MISLLGMVIRLSTQEVRKVGEMRILSRYDYLQVEPGKRGLATACVWVHLAVDSVQKQGSKVIWTESLWTKIVTEAIWFGWFQCRQIVRLSSIWSGYSLYKANLTVHSLCGFLQVSHGEVSRLPSLVIANVISPNAIAIETSRASRHSLLTSNQRHSPMQTIETGTPAGALNESVWFAAVR